MTATDATRPSPEASRRPSRAVLIAGGGLVGLTLALALKRANGPALGVTVLDPNGVAPERQRGRAYAVAAGGRRMLTQLGVWARLEGAAEPITRMEISDSRVSDPVRPTFLSFDTETGRRPEDPFAHMVEAEPFAAALAAACAEADVAVARAGVVRAACEGPRIVATLTSGETLAADLLVAADGARSRLREAARIGWVGRTYPQVGIVATIGHERPHGGRAFEHFLPSGPFAILPLPDGGSLGHRSSIVWTERADEAEALLSGGPDEVMEQIERRFTLDLGALALESGPSSHPLAVGIARAFQAERVALLGDAAHIIHPIAGQGLNLGLADVAALAEGVTEALRLGLDPGAPEVLRAYERARRFDTVAMAAATDGLNRLFSNDTLPVRLARDLGLGLVDRLPGLKGFFIREAAQRSRTVPRLMRGEAL
ncbi:FAD-dependent monooxygenase [Methylobacterium aerolatum]|uniref:2-octaprenyl-6-methoxyphenol hydroxylase n=1 Tax=Methylobacterium aerolatum TaxID=418708 RepID=A0ABU0HYK3_9HYPH|nr:FAD-dependent monooxygenase [Methylobacterium aerolatum]MDQ0446564.1 2-octaprenyl-6-methoxyphenol hydroxylase [Methylobacterium aerolatum]GJD33275.1 Ubiquinone hydroxylase UbiL [Methylobacterium aerolatum]